VILRRSSVGRPRCSGPPTRSISGRRAALRAASDAGLPGGARPVEGTICRDPRARQEAEERAASAPSVADLLAAVVRRGEQALARTPEQLAVLREAGVVDAGGGGAARASSAGHRRRRRRAAAGGAGGARRRWAPTRSTRSCPATATARFRDRGDRLDAEAIEAELSGSATPPRWSATRPRSRCTSTPTSRAGRSPSHDGGRDRPGRDREHARADGGARARLLEAVRTRSRPRGRPRSRRGGQPPPVEDMASRTCIVVEGGQSMNPSVADLVTASTSRAPEVVLLPTTRTSCSRPSGAAEQAGKPVHVVPTTRSPPGSRR